MIVAPPRRSLRGVGSASSASLSVIVPTLNSAGCVEECIESVVSQDYEGIDVLVLDGRSADDTCDIVSSFAERDARIRLISEPDGGIYEAMNKGIRLATGEFLYFLGADDRLHHPAAFGNVFSQPGVTSYDIIYGNVILKQSAEKYCGKMDFAQLLEQNICHQAMFYRRDVFDRVGHYDCGFRSVADWVLNLRCFADPTFRIKYVDETIAVYDQTGFSSQNAEVADFSEFRRAIYADYVRTFSWRRLSSPCWLRLKARSVAGPIARRLRGCPT